MNTVKNISLLLALALSACAADAPDEGGGGGGDDVGKTLDPTGKYNVRSKFDLATNAPGQVGAVLNTILDATDDPDDPANFIMEFVADNVGGVAGNAIDAARPLIAGYLNDRLIGWAPDFVGTMIQLGNDFGQISRNFGTIETLDVSGAAGSYTSIHSVTGAHFTVDGVESEFAFSAYNMENVVVNGVGITYATDGKFDIAQHMVPLSYGKILRIAVDEVLIPLVDANAENLTELLQNLVDCQAVGQYVANAVGYGFVAGPATAGCNAGLVAIANQIYQQVEGIDASALELGLTGAARARDTNNDSKVDVIQTGAWTGEASYAGNPAPLATSTFFGERM